MTSARSAVESGIVIPGTVVYPAIAVVAIAVPVVGKTTIMPVIHRQVQRIIV
jgi:hypothetical protein